MIESYEESQVEQSKSLNAATFLWNAASVVSLIRAYESYSCLWNTQSTGYKRANLKARAWQEISDYLQLPVLDIKRKMSNLLTSYRRERVRVESKRNEKVPYESQLYFYRHFAFMDRVYQPKAFKMADGGVNIEPDYYVDERYAAAENYFKNKKHRQTGLNEIAALFDTSIHDIDRRWRNLRTIYRRELKKVLEEVQNGRKVKVKWFPYPYMDAFLRRVCVKEQEQERGVQFLEDLLNVEIEVKLTLFILIIIMYLLQLSGLLSYFNYPFLISIVSTYL
ncbi:hypothetical protein WDU94_011516 [Cyamophila willieti]